MYIIIPLGGKGERFLNSGYSNPKPLIQVFNKEIICYLLDNLIRFIDYKKDKIYIVYNNDLELSNFSQFINNKYPFSYIHLLKLSYQTKGAAETINLGIKHILKSNIHLFSENCLLLDADTFYTINIIEIIRNKNENVVFYFNDNKKSKIPLFSYISLDENNKITDIKEKIKISNNANTGAYFFKSIHELLKYSQFIIDNNITFNNEYYTSCIIKHMLEKNKPFYGIELNDKHFFSLGTPLQVNNFIENTFAFLFDLDGTLVLSNDIYFNVWNELLKSYNIHVTNEIFETYISGKNDETVLKTLIPNINKKTINLLTKTKDELFIKYINDVTIIDGAIEFIKNLKLSGHKICIVTNCNRLVAESILSHFHLDKYIDFLVIGNECSRPKPYPDPYLHALELLNIKNEKSIIFEDSNSGFLSAKGVYPLCIVGIESNFNKQYLYNLGANITIKDFTCININTIFDNCNNQLSNLNKLVLSNLNHIYDIKDIVVQETKIKGGYIADVIRLNINLKSNDTIDCIVKLENDTPNLLKDMASSLHLYQREYYFYETISKYINISFPKYYTVLKDEYFNQKGIILENLNTQDFTLNLNLNNESIDVSLTVIDRMAKLHSKFWNKNLTSIFEKLKKTNDPIFYPGISQFIHDNWNLFIQKWKHLLSPNQISIGKYIVDNFDFIQLYLSKDNLTFCHGDIKSANIFYKKLSCNNYEPYFIDWQYINHGKGVSDLVFFMIESFEINSINKFNNIFQDYYYTKILEYNVLNYKKDTYINDLKVASCFYPFFVAIWFGTIPNEDLIDVNFPFFYIQKLFNFLEINKCSELYI